MGLLIISVFVAILSTLACAIGGAGVPLLIVTYFGSGMLTCSLLCAAIMIRHYLERPQLGGVPEAAGSLPSVQN